MARNSGLPLSQQQFVILGSIAKAPKHGYAVIKEIKELSNGQLVFTAGTLYENLAGLLAGGYIKQSDRQIETGRLRKIYAITPSGETALSDQYCIIESIIGNNLKC